MKYLDTPRCVLCGGFSITWDKKLCKRCLKAWLDKQTPILDSEKRGHGWNSHSEERGRKGRNPKVLAGCPDGMEWPNLA